MNQYDKKVRGVYRFSPLFYKLTTAVVRLLFFCVSKKKKEKKGVLRCLLCACEVLVHRYVRAEVCVHEYARECVICFTLRKQSHESLT